MTGGVKITDVGGGGVKDDFGDFKTFKNIPCNAIVSKCGNLCLSNEII